MQAKSRLDMSDAVAKGNDLYSISYSQVGLSWHQQHTPVHVSQVEWTAGAKVQWQLCKYSPEWPDAAETARLAFHSTLQGLTINFSIAGGPHIDCAVQSCWLSPAGVALPTPEVE